MRIRLAALSVLASAAVAATWAPTSLGPLEVAENLELVGHDPLLNRGMNAALAVHGDHAYVGSRTDGKPGGENLNSSGVLVLDISEPSDPTVVHEIGPPWQGNEGETSRELRVWPQQELLIVQNLGSNCSALIHACSPRSVRDNFRFYDISGENAAAPELVATYEPSSSPHEFFLWVDPHDPARALMFISATRGNRLVVTDISAARAGRFTELTSWAVTAPGGDLHSLGVSNDGTEAYLAYLTGGFHVADTSDVVDDDPSAEISLVTSHLTAPRWDGPGAHSAVKLYGSDTVVVTDEVYGEALSALGHGCPFGWTRTIDITNRVSPQVIGEYKLPANEEDACRTSVPRPVSTVTAHNPTVTDDLAFITWHSGGLQVVDLDDPTEPARAGQFLPDPLPFVLQEDPVLSAGQDKVVMWSYPIIQDGLVHVVDVRNGYYVLEYTGEEADEVAGIEFLEGNSNLGDALVYEPVGPPTD